MLRGNISLRELYLSENELGDEGVSHLTEGLLENKTLRKLDLRSNGIGVEGALSLATVVKKSNTLIGLYLGMNEVGNAGVEALAHGLTYSRLQKIDLCDNGISASGTEAISRMLQINTSLQELNLSFNSIGDTGASSIANVLDENLTLRCLSLKRNRIGNKGACAFAAKLPTMRGLKELVMIKNSIDQDGAAALLKGLRQNMELEYLHVEDKVSEPILREIVHWIRLNRAGRRIFRNTNFPAKVWPKVLSNINYDIDVLYHFLREKPDVFQYSRKRKLSAN
jgi:Ran GTPase-activating protein (RanGAP) involved in mRNA processing and transport